MRKPVICLLFAVLLVVPTTSAASQEIKYDVKGDEAHVSRTFETNVSSLELWTEEDAYNFELRVNGERRAFDLEKRRGLNLLKADLETGRKDVEVEYRTSDAIEKGERSYFITTLHGGPTTENVSLELVLPERALVKEGGSSVSPEPESIETEGRRMSISWKWTGLEEGEEIPIFVAYEQRDNVWFPLSVASVVIIVMLAAAFLYQRIRGKQKKFDKRFQHLVEKEREVVDALMEKDDYTMWQKELQNATGFTKSKLSRTLKRMEERGIVEKMPYGTSNKVKLVEEQD